MKIKESNAISQNVKKYRLLNKMTQEELAEKLYVDTQYYSQLERGERNFTIEKLIRLCSIFHIGIEDIIVLEPAEPDNSEEMLQRLQAYLKALSPSQLNLVEKFILEFIPFVK